MRLSRRVLAAAMTLTLATTICPVNTDSVSATKKQSLAKARKPLL